MSTPQDRAKPPRPALPVIHGCVVCGADPTHFAADAAPNTLLCDDCDSVPWTVAGGIGAALVLLAPIPSPFLAMLALSLGLLWMCRWAAK